MLNIKNPRAHELAVAVSIRTGETLTDTVIHALEDRLNRVSNPDRRREMDMVRVEALLTDIRARLPDNFMRNTDPTSSLYDDETGAPV